MSNDAREAVARALAEQCDSGSADYWDMWVKDADAAIAALKPIIVAEIRAWAEELDGVWINADSLASRICGGGE